ncbi:MAG: VWA domain-containing protein [Planctomycetales bacterium]|nr:VWA domain-containing protein [Planctomycetales bacterium]
MVRGSSHGKSSLPDWLPRVLVIPSFLSAVVHGAFLIFFATALRSCDQAPVGFSDEILRTVGIRIKDAKDRPQSEGEVSLNASPSEFASAEKQAVPLSLLPETPPAEVLLPTADIQTAIGPGVNRPKDDAIPQLRELIKSNGTTRPKFSGTAGGPRGVSFMGTRDEGMKIIYAIDASGSMQTSNSIQVAKNAMLSSLYSLDEHQQFLVIFYDDQPHVLKINDEPKPTLTHATEINKTFARQKIAGIQPGSGTDHFLALELALKLHPDVIFFLTDAGDEMQANQMQKIQKLNSGRVRIHTIEFGNGPELVEYTLNFLRVLARRNGGTYRYHDVTTFRTP